MREEKVCRRSTPCKISAIITVVGLMLLFLSISIEVLFLNVDRAQRGVFDVLSYSSLYVAILILVPSVPLSVYLCERPEERDESKLCEILHELQIGGVVLVCLSLLAILLRGEIEPFRLPLLVGTAFILMLLAPSILACLIWKDC